MTASASVITRPFDWKVWAPGFVLPVACVLGDFVLGEYVLWWAPATLLALMAIGMAALAVTRWKGEAASGSLTMGPLWVAGMSALAIGAMLVLLVPLGLVMALSALKTLDPMSLVFFICSVLALTPLWTGVTYLKGAIAVTRRQTEAGGASKTLLKALLGVMATVCVITAAHAADSRWVRGTIDQLKDETPAAWEATLASLRAYPLCGRTRCRWLVCQRLLEHFPASPTATMPFAAEVPAQLDVVFVRTYGQSTEKLCTSFD